MKAEHQSDEHRDSEQRTANEAKLGLMLRRHSEKESGNRSQFARQKVCGKIEAKGRSAALGCDGISGLLLAEEAAPAEREARVHQEAAAETCESGDKLSAPAERLARMQETSP